MNVILRFCASAAKLIAFLLPAIIVAIHLLVLPSLPLFLSLFFFDCCLTFFFVGPGGVALVFYAFGFIASSATRFVSRSSSFDCPGVSLLASALPASAALVGDCSDVGLSHEEAPVSLLK